MSNIHDWVGAYATDSLEPSERALFERHLDECTDCRLELAEGLETLDTMAAGYATPPPPELRSSILQAISAVPQLDTEKSASMTELASRSRRPFTTWLAAAAAVLVIALGGAAVYQQNHIASIAALEQQRTELLTAPDVQVHHAQLDGGSVTYVVSSELGRAMVTATNLPDPGADRSWQVWVVKDGTPQSGAVLDAGGVVQEFVAEVTGGQALAMTNEPTGGSEQPTGEVQAAVEI